MSKEQSLSIANPHPNKVDVVQKLGLVLASLGVLVLFVAWAKIDYTIIGVSHTLLLSLSLGSILVGTVIYSVRSYMTVPEGIKNNGIWHKSFTNRGVLGWVAGIILTGFYIMLYWYPSLLGVPSQTGESNSGLVALFNPLSQFFVGKDAGQWFVYGTIYTLVIVTLGIKFIYKYRHNKYQLIRTVVVIISQLFLAYLIPQILEGMNVGAEGNYYGKDLKNSWPLNYGFVDHYQLNNMTKAAEQPIGMIFLVWGIIMFAVITPVVTYFVGKRWYCSWVCGCGGLAETAGDPYRHLSDKSVEAWQIERVIINGVIVFVTIMTGLLMYSYFSGSDFYFGVPTYVLLPVLYAIGGWMVWKHRKTHPHLRSHRVPVVTAVILIVATIYYVYQFGIWNVHFTSASIRQWYGFFVGAAFSGVIGVGFYPLLGNRVWCRFGCPMAGYMGLIQRFKSKFRITTNGGQCISCGNCSTYCEQGIDVRAYAQRGENIVRSSCVGCGICSAVCPRGVLKLENGPETGRIIEMPEITGTVAKK